MFDLIRRTENDLLAFPNLVSRLFDTAVRPEVYGSLVPPVDIVETSSEFLLMAECAGLSRDSLNVSLEGSTITISGEKTPPSTVKDDQCYRIERRYGKFSRSFTLPVGVEAGKIQASYKDGILEVKLPKAPEAQPQRIRITGA